MVSRRRAFGGALGVWAIGLVVACNELLGAPDRVLDEGDASLQPDRRKPDAPILEPEDGGPVDPKLDAGPDAPGTVTITIGTDWMSPNGATWVVDGGTAITGFSASHPVILPLKQPALPSDDYTVFATVRAPADGEFGILTRVQANGSAVVVGSKFGGESKPFLGSFTPPNWNPSDDSRGQLYTFVPGGRYKFKIRALGSEVAGKMWEASQPEPPSFQVVAASPWATGRGVGYYTYGVTGSVLESLQITIP
jgi:hypothetical protein